MGHDAHVRLEVLPLDVLGALVGTRIRVEVLLTHLLLDPGGGADEVVVNLLSPRQQGGVVLGRREAYDVVEDLLEGRPVRRDGGDDGEGDLDLVVEELDGDLGHVVPGSGPEAVGDEPGLCVVVVLRIGN